MYSLATGSLDALIVEGKLNHYGEIFEVYHSADVLLEDLFMQYHEAIDAAS